ncbi:RBPJ-interacting and tubulin-associated protein 1-like [Diadema setosum]|uniref:RBPJ-interacting and tubulin-associated protein 1-like n=1 Tax=Diadema setosum TaxID=31175 RepID=UPI003B3A031D
MANLSGRYSFSDEDGRQSGLSLQGESMGRQSPNVNPKKSYKYRFVSHESSIDETLFGSHRDRRKSTDDWNDSPQQKSSPHGRKESPSIKPQLSSMPMTRNKYRIRKHTPTYIDQSLFGAPLQEPSFEAPWTDKKADRRRNTTLTWAPPVQGSMCFEAESRPSSVVGDRPGSASGRPRSASGSRPGSATGSRPRSSSGSRPQSASGRRSATPNKPPPWK